MFKYVKQKIKELLAWHLVRHISGIKHIGNGKNEAVVTCLVKNGEYYIDSFINHYTKLGFKHIFLLDNNSTDNTRKIAEKYANVSIYQTSLPVSKYQALLKKTLVKKVVNGGWCLDVDIDEFFEYPYSVNLRLDRFIDYLNNGNYTIVVTQMLDMFSGKDIGSIIDSEKNLNVDNYLYYDLSEINFEKYEDSYLASEYAKNNSYPHNTLKLIYGGIRKKIYDIDCLLTKHSFFKVDEGLELFPHNHFVNNGVVADVTCLLLHYKLTSNCVETSLLNKKSFKVTSQGYDDLVKFIESNPDYSIKTIYSKKYYDFFNLVDCGFVTVSSQFNDYYSNPHRYNNE